VVKCALQIAPLVFVRPGELRHAEWSEIDLEKAEWSISGTKMKMGEDHLVPLSSQVVEILTELKKLTGEGRFAFRTQISPDSCIGEGTLVTALRTLGYDKTEMTTHGFRAMARTILDEVLQVRPDLIEHQLAHAVKDPNGRAYNRTKFLEQRRAMMQTWADYLDGLKEGAKVLAFRKVEN
jgi:integrase